MARILIVEDNAPQLRLLAIWLQRNGHTVLEATDGRRAQELLSDRRQGAGREPPNLIITDVNMPDFSGIELVHWVRTECRLEIPILVLSSRCDQAHLSDQLGGFGVVVHAKPFSPSRVMAEIDRLLAGASRAITGATKGTHG